MADARLTFLSWSRDGLAVAIAAADSSTSRAVVTASVRVDRRDATGASASPESVEASIQMYGPGDVTAIDERVVSRVEPERWASAVPPNNFPFVEFSRADFPWMFTPRAPSSEGRLAPWLSLIAIPDGVGARLSTRPDRPLPVLEIASGAGQHLPNLSESWAWAHVQVAGEAGAASNWRELQRAHPERVLSRLICPRKLEAETHYFVCLVPAFEVGRKAGLGEALDPVDEAALEPAWSNDTDTVRLPVYLHWEFNTGRRGDFESLAKLLEARRIPDDVGRRPMKLPASLSASTDPEIFDLEGALRHPEAEPQELRPDIERAVVDLLPGAGGASDGVPRALTPPLWAEWHTRTTELPAQGEPPVWMRELNVDPRNRVAAGLGAEVVRRDQEHLMASAWDQVGDLRQANQVLQQGQLSREASGAVYRKRVAVRDVEDLLRMTVRVHSRLAVEHPTGGTRATVAAHLRGGRIPSGVLTSAFARLTRPRGPQMRRFGANGEWPDRLLERLNDGSLDPVPPLVVAPDGAALLTRSELGTLLDDPLRQEDVPVVDEGELDALLDGSPPVADREESDRFKEELGRMRERGETAARAPANPSPGAALDDLSGLAESLRLALDPEITVPRAVRARVAMPGRFDDPNDALAPLVVGPRFPQPMYEALRELSQEHILTGLEKVPPNTVTVVEANPRFVESYMVGLNHEMSRELLWRGFPGDRRGTYFDRFWDATSDLDRVNAPGGLRPQIARLHGWPAGKRLGEMLLVPAPLVLLIRGELLRRYPTTLIYAVAAEWVGGPVPRGTPESQWPRRRPREVQPDERFPTFRGSLRPDVDFVGFDLTREQAIGGDDPAAAEIDPGWFFVLQSPPADPLFGLNEVLDETDAGRSLAEIQAMPDWNGLGWGDLFEAVADLAGGPHVPVAGRLDGVTIDSKRWGRSAADMGAVMLQRPVRLAIHADDMLGGSGGD